jgi:hypothetical protein
MKNFPINTDWLKIQEFYANISVKLHEQGIKSLTTGGIACVLYGITQQTKDCDIIIPEERTEDVIDILEKLQIDDQRCQITLKYGAPLNRDWLRGGWSSHTFFGTPENVVARIDLFGRPPRVPLSQPDDNPHYLSRDGVARMKKTRREKDWAYANQLGHQMLKRGEIEGVLHITDIETLVDTCKKNDIGLALRNERPILQLAIENSPELERYVKAEKEFWSRLDHLRLTAYEKAWKPYGDAIQMDSKNLIILPFRTQNEALIEHAEKHLDPSPLNTIGWENLVNQAKDKTAQIFQNIDRELLPSPIAFTNGNGMTR